MTGKSLWEMQIRVRNNNIEKGWRDSDRTFGDLIALAHSELSEALEAYRHWLTEDATTDIGDGRPKPEGVGSELADVLIRLLDMADIYGFDLEQEFDRKMAYNQTRSYRHGGKHL